MPECLLVRPPCPGPLPRPTVLPRTPAAPAWRRWQPVAAASAAIVLPLGVVLAGEAAQIRSLGYTRSLLLFLVPVLSGAAWIWRDRRGRRTVQWRALATTVSGWTAIGWLLDLALAATFFRFPDEAATCGVAVPGLDLASLGFVPVPIEEFAFYLLGFLAAITVYLWLDRRVFAARRITLVGGDRRRRARVHAPTLAAGAVALAVAWFGKGALPGYTLFLVVAAVIPNAWLMPLAWPHVNGRALTVAMVVLGSLAALWETTLALPNGWWAYEERHMVAMIETPWSRLPVEAIAVWLLWPWTTVLTYEALRARAADGQRSRFPRFLLAYPHRRTAEPGAPSHLTTLPTNQPARLATHRRPHCPHHRVDIDRVPADPVDLLVHQFAAAPEHQHPALLPRIALHPALPEPSPERTPQVRGHAPVQRAAQRPPHAGRRERLPADVAQHDVCAGMRLDEVHRHRRRAGRYEHELRARRGQFLLPRAQLRRAFPAEQSTEVPQEHHDGRRLSELCTQGRDGPGRGLQFRRQHRIDARRHRTTSSPNQVSQLLAP